MNLGLKNRLRLISLLPIILLLSVTSYFLYNSYTSYKSAKILQDELTANKVLNDLIINISRERGMTVMYIANKSPNTYRSLIKQRKIVNKKREQYIEYAKENSSIYDNSVTLKVISNSFKTLKNVRNAVDSKDVAFNAVYKHTYGQVIHDIVLQLENMTKNQTDTKLNEFSAVYLSMVKAIEFTSSERDFISYKLSRKEKLSENDLNFWLSLIAKADGMEYNSLQDMALTSQLNKIFRDEDTKELFDDINKNRASIISKSSTGNYKTDSIFWFAMLSEKANIVLNAENVVVLAMNERAKEIEANTVTLLSVTIAIWVVSLVLALLGFFLANDITKNIKKLEDILRRFAKDSERKDGDDMYDINLHTAKGTTEAYELLENILEQTKQDKEFAQEASQAKSMFLANMSHEIRTPLNGIVGFTELLKDTGLEEEQQEFVEIIEKSSENLLEIINNILDLSKIESNKLEIEDIVFNPIEEFESAVEVYAVRASEKNIHLGCFIDPQLEQPLKGDPTKIKEVLINLLSNAVKFTSSAGSINIRVIKEESEYEGVTKVRFEVQDSGIGVTGEQKARIFEAFSQADTSITRKYGGTGLGLTISSRFIELMGGKLDLESAVGEGTTFFFTIDFEEAPAQNETLKEHFKDISVLVLKNEHKSKEQEKNLYKYLNYYGVQYTNFENFSQAKEFNEKGDYDLIFIDYEYIQDENFTSYNELSQEIVLLTKSSFMKKIDSLNVDIYKTIYEPLNGSKVRSALAGYVAYKNDVAKQGKKPKVKFNADDAKFNANVLVAEDNIINQKLIKRTLEDIGLTVSIASNGLEAFQKRKDGNFDLIFMDIQMPFLDGVEATKEILDYEADYKQPHVPIIALTANALKGDRERFLSAGLDEYTVKPIVRSEIVSILNQYLSQYIVTSTQNNEESTPKPKPKSEPKPEPEMKKEYKSDILLARKNPFEVKIYSKLFESLGYTLTVAKSTQEFESNLKDNNYKIVFFDKALANENTISTIASNGLNTATIFIKEDDSQSFNGVDESINHVVNKELLQKILQKYI